MTDQRLKNTGLPLSYLHKSQDATTALTKKAFKDREERLRSPGGTAVLLLYTVGFPLHSLNQMSLSFPWEPNSLWKQFSAPPNGADISVIKGLPNYVFKDPFLFVSL